MSSEQAAFQASQNRHNRYMGFGKKQRYIEVFQCSGEDMNLFLTGNSSSSNLANLAMPVVSVSTPSLLNPSVSSAGKTPGAGAGILPAGMLSTLPPNNLAGVLSLPTALNDPQSLLAAQLNPFLLGQQNPMLGANGQHIPIAGGVPPLIPPVPSGKDPKLSQNDTTNFALLNGLSTAASAAAGAPPLLPFPGSLPAGISPPTSALGSSHQAALNGFFFPQGTLMPQTNLAGGATNPTASFLIPSQQQLLQSQLAAQRLLQSMPATPAATPGVATNAKRSFHQAFPVTDTTGAGQVAAKRSSFVYGPAGAPTISAGPTTYPQSQQTASSEK